MYSFSILVKIEEPYIRPMVQEMLNILGLHVPAALACKHNKAVIKYLDLEHFGVKNIGHDEKLYTKRRLEEEVAKEERYTSAEVAGAREPDCSILDQLTPSDVRALVKADMQAMSDIVWNVY